MRVRFRAGCGRVAGRVERRRRQAPEETQIVTRDMFYAWTKTCTVRQIHKRYEAGVVRGARRRRRLQGVSKRHRREARKLQSESPIRWTIRWRGHCQGGGSFAAGRHTMTLSIWRSETVEMRVVRPDSARGLQALRGVQDGSAS